MTRCNGDPEISTAAPGGDGGTSELDVTVTEALARAYVWSRGKPTRRLLQAVSMAAHIGLPVQYSGSRARFIIEGQTVSLAEFHRRIRAATIRSRATCRGCGEPIPVTAYARQQRGARSDRRYCSNACRQKAYRKKSGVNGTHVD